MIKTKITVLILSSLLILTVLSSGCLEDDDDDLLNVVVTIPPQMEWVENVGGDNVKVTVMVPPGADPHTYEPTVSQMKAVSDADIYFKIGSGVEFEKRWMDTLIEHNSDMVVVDGNVGIHLLDYEHQCDHEQDPEHILEEIEHIIHEWEDGGITAEEALEAIEELMHDYHHQDHILHEIEHIIHEWEDGDITAEDAMEAIDELMHHNEDHDHEGDDPHTWLSPVNAKIMVNNLLDALVELDPDNEEYYRDNAQGYIDKLDSLHLSIKADLQPYHGRKFLIYHPSMGYFAHEYGIIQIGVEREGREPGASGLMAVIEQAKEEGIRVVFVSPQFDKSNAQTIADEIDGEVIQLNPLAEDYLENLEDISSKLISAFESS